MDVHTVMAGLTSDGAGTWGGSPPGAGDNAIIDHDCTFDGLTADSLVVSASKTLKTPDDDPSTYTFTGTVTVAGTLKGGDGGASDRGADFAIVGTVTVNAGGVVQGGASGAGGRGGNVDITGDVACAGTMKSDAAGMDADGGVVTVDGDVVATGSAVICVFQATGWQLNLTGDSRCTGGQYELIIHNSTYPSTGISFGDSDDKVVFESGSLYCTTAPWVESTTDRWNGHVSNPSRFQPTLTLQVLNGAKMPINIPSPGFIVFSLVLFGTLTPTADPDEIQRDIDYSSTTLRQITE